jgi:predicted CoA-binding protein
MTGESCPLPGGADDKLEVIRRLVAATRIAIVGLSDNPSRPSYEIASYLLGVGKEIVPVNPNHQMVRGLKCYPSLEDVAGKIELVNVFRRPEFCADVVKSAIRVGAKGIWLQSGIVNRQARELADRAGIDFVEDRCIMVEHMQLIK